MEWAQRVRPRPSTSVAQPGPCCHPESKVTRLPRWGSEASLPRPQTLPSPGRQRWSHRFSPEAAAERWLLAAGRERRGVESDVRATGCGAWPRGAREPWEVSGEALMEPPSGPSCRTSTSSATRQPWNTSAASTTMQRKAMGASGPTPPAPRPPPEPGGPRGPGPPAAAFLHGLWEQRSPRAPHAAPATSPALATAFRYLPHSSFPSNSKTRGSRVGGGGTASKWGSPQDPTRAGPRT